ncbi:hypothetical protein [Lysinibacillus sp. NPDC093688]|uniref:hypothetical protein n=1 Tax=Lysinibacillus sp. NPDC093688 TaxID=3390577 RepID=UPI003D086C12
MSVLCESEATATWFCLCESEAAATWFCLCESEAAATTTTSQHEVGHEGVITGRAAFSLRSPASLALPTTCTWRTF